MPNALSRRVAPDTTEMVVEPWVRARLGEVRIQEPNREQIEDIEDED